MIPDSLSPIANHLWQSTVFAGAAGLLTLALRKNPAGVRHWIWVATSVKFLIPFSVLIAIGSHIQWRTAPASAAPSFSIALDQAAQPFAVPAPVAVRLAPAANQLPPIAWTLWACGFIGIAGSSLVRYRRIAAAVRAGSLVDLGIPIQAICSPAFIEPGIFGVFRPVLLLPDGIFDQLTPQQWKAVLAHELCHVRRRDNFIGLLQLFVETVFWFHPLTWWIGKRILEERERACDEEVVKLGNEPRAYARGILKVCERYLESSTPCVAGVSGSNLKTRIEAILNERIAKDLNDGTKALLAAAGVFAVAVPIAIGLLEGVTLRAQTVSPSLRFDVASVKPWQPDPKAPAPPRSSGIPGPDNNDPGRFTAHTNLLNLVLAAWDIPAYQLSETADLYTRRLEVEAKMPVDTTREQFNVMLRNLLADRLGLKVHWTTRQMEIYAPVVAKGGPKLRPAAPDLLQPSESLSNTGNAFPLRIGPDGFPLPPPGNRPWMALAPGGKAGMRGHNETAAEMARSIGMRTLDGPLTDATGLTNRYDYTLFWSMQATTAALGAAPTVDPDAPGIADGPGIFDAVRDQLGLKIEKRRGPMQILVIDHVDKKPTEN